MIAFRSPVSLPTAVLASLLAALALAGCAAPEAPVARTADRPCAAPHGADESPLPEDQAVRRRLEKALHDLADAGRTATLGELAPQLERRAAAIETVAAPAEPLERDRLLERLRGAVVIVGKRFKCPRCPNWHVSGASGFLLDRDGAVVTSHHVVDGNAGDSIAVMTADGQVHAVREVLAADAPSDVAILRTTAAGREPLPLADDTPLGEDLWVLGHPAGAWWYLSRGTVARRFADRRDGARIDLLDITADFARGSSGGPAVDARGRVHGIVRATRSIYYEEDDGVQKNLQMVFKHCAPADAIRALLAP